VAACFVTGIVPTEEVPTLEKMLGDVPGVDHALLTILTKCDRSDEHDSSFLNFIHCGAPAIEGDVIGRIGGDSIMTNAGGTSVPGITARNETLGYFAHPHVEQHVGTLPIPEDEADNYNDAIDSGRVVVAYNCGDGDTSTLEKAFRESGVLHVKTFRG